MKLELERKVKEDFDNIESLKEIAKIAIEKFVQIEEEDKINVEEQIEIAEKKLKELKERLKMKVTEIEKERQKLHSIEKAIEDYFDFSDQALAGT